MVVIGRLGRLSMTKAAKAFGTADGCAGSGVRSIARQAHDVGAASAAASSGHASFALLFTCAQQLGHYPRGFPLAMGSASSCQNFPRLAQLGEQFRRDLTHRLRLARQFRQIVAINYTRRPNPTRGWVTLSSMQTSRTWSTPR